ncbi:MAG: S-layer homology domain-containing protein, partial [Eubacteriales bacterium]
VLLPILITLDGTANLGTITMPKSNIISTISITGTPILAVGNVDLVAEDEAGSTTEKVEVKLEISAPTSVGQNLISTSKEDNETVEIWMDISLSKTVGEGASTPITETNSLLEIVFELSATLQGYQGYAVYREHDGVVDKIYTTPNSDGEYLEIRGNYLVLHVKKFSTYAIAYADTPITAPKIPTTSVTPPISSNIPTRYTAIIPALQSGTITTSPEKPLADDVVIITLEGVEGLYEITVANAYGAAIEVTRNDDGSYSFVQPASMVTIQVLLVEELPITFADVSPSDWYYESVELAHATGLMNGVGEGRFAPEAVSNRAMIASILYSLVGKPEVEGENFSDIPDGAWYADAVLWARQEGISSGMGENRFAPDSEVTREQLVVMLYAFEQQFGSGGFVGTWMFPLDFGDIAEVSQWGYEATAWCTMNGIIEGRDGGNFAPSAHANRGEVAQIIMNYVTQFWG